MTRAEHKRRRRELIDAAISVYSHSLDMRLTMDDAVMVAHNIIAKCDEKLPAPRATLGHAPKDEDHNQKA